MGLGSRLFDYYKPQCDQLACPAAVDSAWTSLWGWTETLRNEEPAKVLLSYTVHPSFLLH